MNRPTPPADLIADLIATTRAMWDNADPDGPGHTDREWALIDHAADTFDPETGTWRKPVVRRWAS